MQIGIVGLPFSGKTTLFQAVTGHRNEPLLTGRQEARKAVVRVPDVRVEELSRIFNPRSTVFAAIEFLDVAGLRPGESGAAQFTTEFFSGVRTNDALVQVVRFFGERAVPHSDALSDALRDIAAFETEILLADLAVVETRLGRIREQVQKSGPQRGRNEVPVLEKCLESLESGNALREVEFSREELQILRTYQLLSVKPMLVALNCDETQVGVAGDLVLKVAEEKAGRNTKVLSFFGKIDMEIGLLAREESTEFLAGYGIREPALDTLIREAYALLGLRSFFTVGQDECRAWTVRNGVTAQEASGVIHSEISSRFIRAEVVHYDDFLMHGGSFPKTKEAGVWRLEGKEYLVKDGDIMSVRHG